MTDYVQHTLTKAEKEARRAERLRQQEQERQSKIAAIPDQIHGIPVVEVSYTAVSKKRVKEMRREFTGLRKAFLKELAATQTDALKQMGLSDRMIALLAKGDTPNGFNVHHKMPLAGGGKNEFSNFILIKNDPYHTDIHKVSDLQISKMKEGETQTVKIPMPQGSVFIPPEKQQNQTITKAPAPVALLQKLQKGR